MSKQPFVGLEDTKCEAPDTQKQLKKKGKRNINDGWKVNNKLNCVYYKEIEACRRANEERKPRSTTINMEN